MTLSILFVVIWIKVDKYLWALKNEDSLLKKNMLFVFSNIMLGLSFGNSFWVIVYYMNMFASSNINPVLISTAVIYAALATITATIGGTILSLRMDSFKITNSSKIMKIMRILCICFIGYIVIYLISFILALLGFEELFYLLMSVAYGYGWLSIIFSIIGTMFASFLFLAIIEEVISLEYKNYDKASEYGAGALLAQGMINLFLELFKLILRLLVIFNDND